MNDNQRINTRHHLVSLWWVSRFYCYAECRYAKCHRAESHCAVTIVEKIQACLDFDFKLSKNKENNLNFVTMATQ
jgi:hypothetical protein